MDGSEIRTESIEESEQALARMRGNSGWPGLRSRMSEIAATTDIDRAARVIAQAANRLRRLEAEAELAFAEWMGAQAQAKECGLPVEVELGAGMQAALSEFRQRAARAEAREIARDEFRRGVT